MKKLTKKQRKEFYLQAAEYFSKELEGDKRLKILGRVAGFCDYCKYYLKYCEQFPEFLLFDYGSDFYWFENDKDRVIALLFCSAMCED